ncbi:hypothetical protein [Burkholderia sp. L27(2015)]|uniref:hypothetical protein n=1 Tax=Burkholderia sp. L27(2015) TaxID=1641858 RepID=UPI00131C10D4|nr:hypothetical protein [Burkholderia sp. L27(2015)]
MSVQTLSTGAQALRAPSAVEVNPNYRTARTMLLWAKCTAVRALMSAAVQALVHEVVQAAFWVTAAACVACVMVPAARAASAEADAPTLAQIRPIIEQRCIQCHAVHPTLVGSAAAGIRLDTPADISDNAAMIFQQTVVLQAMPLNNSTGMTLDERARLAQWFNAGARP